MRCRVIPHETADGPLNMAFDQALLESIDSRPESAAFRTYGWSTPTLSLGYFQGLSEFAENPRWAGLPTIRRPTGGGALWHDHEITYALVVPRDTVPSSIHAYRAVHDAIAALLRAAGLDARRRGPGTRPEPRPLLCFEDRDPEDVVVGASKVVGSAQRKNPRALLQHGSILLARSDRTPGLPGVFDLGAIDGIDPEALAESVVAALGFEPVPSDFTEAERASAHAIAESRYRTREWTGRR